MRKFEEFVARGGLLFAWLAVLIIALVARIAHGGELRDGTTWKQYNHTEKEAWAVGWMDGLCAGERIVAGLHRDPDYHAALLKLNGMESEQLIAGMDQFYAADYRNLSVGIQDAALAVAMRARGMTDAETKRLLDMLREKYQRATVAKP